MLFGELWYEYELCILFADTNLGKSILAVQIGDSISKGKAIEGMALEAHPQKVIYFDFELSEKQFENRYSKDFFEHYVFSDNFYRVEIDPDANIPEFLDFESYLNNSLEQTIIETGTKVLIIDNLTYLKSETEKARNALPLMKHLKALKAKYGLSILALAHTPKRDLSKPISRNDLQGSKMLINFVDSCFSIGESHQDKHLRYLKQIKARNTEIIYDSENVYNCEIQKPSNFLKFVFIGLGNERKHLKVYSDRDREIVVLKVKELVQQINAWQIEPAAVTIKALQSVGEKTDQLDQQLESVKRDQSVEKQIDEIKTLISTGRFQQALQQVEATRSIADDSRLGELEQSARVEIERVEIAKRDAEDRQRRTLERIAEANKRQRARRQNYNSYLSSVESALARGDNETARRWLESARALQIDDQALASLDRRVQLAEDFAEKPLTQYEIRYASDRFNALKEAIEAKNNSRIADLSEGQPSKRGFLDNLFARYRQITLEVVEVQPVLNPKRVMATIRIETLAKANGDIVYPAQSYRDIPVSMRRERYSWSRIEW